MVLLAARTAVVVVSYGSHGLLDRYLSETSTDSAADVIVVDNWSGSAERTAVRTLARDRGWSLVEMPVNAGFGAGANAGVARARERGADVVVLLNPDLAISADTVHELAKIASDSPRTVVAPVITRPDGSVWSAGGALDLRRGTATSRRDPGPPAWISGACLATSVEFFEELGGFDPRYFLYWEDVDLSWRVREAGGRLMVRDDLTAVHLVGGTQTTAPEGGKSNLYRYHVTRGRLLFASLHLGRARAARWLLSSPAYALEVSLRGGGRALLRAPWTALAALAGTLAGAARLVAGPRRQHDGRPRVVIAHPSPDLYGSDRQMLETVTGLAERGWAVTVAMPTDGPLSPLVRQAGGEVALLSTPVLRKALLSPHGLVRLAVGSAAASIRLARWLRASGADVLLVNTVTIPPWLAAARLARVPALCHIHEAEDGSSLLLRALATPLYLARRLVFNSEAARAAVLSRTPRLAARSTVIHNGVPGPSDEPLPARHLDGSPWRLVLVGRLSPRKGVDVALAATARLRHQGLDVELRVCGTAYAGYEWYQHELEQRAQEPDLAGRVTFAGYVHPTWPELAAAHVVLVPSRAEPFGNTAVEGMLARRAVVASAVQGLAEVLDNGRTGLLVAPGDDAALAGAVARLVQDAELLAELADRAREDAMSRFSVQRYRSEIVAAVEIARLPRRAAKARGR